MSFQRLIPIRNFQVLNHYFRSPKVKYQFTVNKYKFVDGNVNCHDFRISFKGLYGQENFNLYMTEFCFKF